jgi:hypothetical protein
MRLAFLDFLPGGISYLETYVDNVSKITEDRKLKLQVVVKWVHFKSHIVVEMMRLEQYLRKSGTNGSKISVRFSYIGTLAKDTGQARVLTSMRLKF